MKGAIAKIDCYGETIVGKYGIPRDVHFKKGTIFHIVSRREKGRVFIVEKVYGGRRYKIIAADLREVEVEPTSIGGPFILTRNKVTKRRKKRSKK